MATTTFYVLRVYVGQDYVLCCDVDGDPYLKPAYKACLHSEAWAFDSGEEALEEAESQNFQMGCVTVLEVEE